MDTFSVVGSCLRSKTWQTTETLMINISINRQFFFLGLTSLYKAQNVLELCRSIKNHATILKQLILLIPSLPMHNSLHIQINIPSILFHIESIKTVKNVFEAASLIRLRC